MLVSETSGAALQLTPFRGLARMPEIRARVLALPIPALRFDNALAKWQQAYLSKYSN